MPSHISAAQRATHGSAIFNAARVGDTRQLEKLLQDRPSSASWQTEGGVTPLHVACVNGHETCVKLLLDAGANVDALTNSQASPLIVAARALQPQVMRELLEAGANIALSDLEGKTVFDIELNDKCAYELAQALARAEYAHFVNEMIRQPIHGLLVYQPDGLVAVAAEGRLLLDRSAAACAQRARTKLHANMWTQAIDAGLAC